jgi:hypothetical protein
METSGSSPKTTVFWAERWKKVSRKYTHKETDKQQHPHHHHYQQQQSHAKQKTYGHTSLFRK